MCPGVRACATQVVCLIPTGIDCQSGASSTGGVRVGGSMVCVCVCVWVVLFSSFFFPSSCQRMLCARQVLRLLSLLCITNGPHARDSPLAALGVVRDSCEASTGLVLWLDWLSSMSCSTSTQASKTKSSSSLKKKSYRPTGSRYLPISFITYERAHTPSHQHARLRQCSLWTIWSNMRSDISRVVRVVQVVRVVEVVVE